MAKQKKRVVLADIAKEAGVSAVTVSAVLHDCKGNNTRFSEATRRKVQQVARKLGYRANRTFRNLNRKRQGSIGVVHEMHSLVSSYAMDAMAEEAAGKDYLLVFSHSEGELPIFLKEDAVDGVILFGEMDETFRGKVEELHLPTVHVNSNRRLAPGTLTYDEYGGMKQSVEAFAERGCRQILLLELNASPQYQHYSRELRWKGLCEQSKACALAHPVRHALKQRWGCDLRASLGNPDAVVEEIMAVLQTHADVDAVLLNYRIVGAALYEAARRMGKAVPDDLSVIAINPFDPLDHLYPPTSMVTLDFEALGRTIVRMMDAIIETGVEHVEPVCFPLELVRRGSA